MLEIVEQIGVIFGKLLELLQSIGSELVPWLPLLAWVAFWMFAVNWKKYRAALLQGGIIGLILVGLVWILVWGSIAPPLSGSHHIFGLTLNNFFGKMVYVSMLYCIMFLCGAAQLSGFCANWMCFEEDHQDEAEASHH